MCLFAVSSVMSNIRRLQKLPNDTIFYMATYFNMNAKQESLNKTPYQNVITYLSSKTLSLTSLQTFSPLGLTYVKKLYVVYLFSVIFLFRVMWLERFTPSHRYTIVSKACVRKKNNNKKKNIKELRFVSWGT